MTDPQVFKEVALEEVGGWIAPDTPTLTLGEVLETLASRYPLEDAEPWDRVGLLWGDPARPVRRAACALDPNLKTLKMAASRHIDLLVTHHPTHLAVEEGEEPPEYGHSLDRFAVEYSIPLIAMHTNLDVSEPARLRMGEDLPFEPLGPLVTEIDKQGRPRPAFAQQWKLTEPIRAIDVAHLCAQKYGAPVHFSRPAPQLVPWRQERIVTASGAGGDALSAAVASGATLFITGELKYHERLEAVDRGLCCIEVGHDNSEWPLVSLLRDTVIASIKEHGYKPQPVDFFGEGTDSIFVSPEG